MDCWVIATIETECLLALLQHVNIRTGKDINSNLCVGEEGKIQLDCDGDLNVK